MKTKFILFSASIICLLIFSSGLNAIGLGIYANGSKADYAWTYHIDESEDPEIDSTVSKYGLGFVLDTCVARNNLFNYRLNIGYSKLNISNDEMLPDMTANEYSLYNSFGFGVFRSQPARIWLGPQLGFGFMRGEFKSSSAWDDNNFWTMFYSYGLVLGVNFNIEDIMTIGVDGGFRISKHAGTANIYTVSTADETTGLTAEGREFFANFSVIFRIADVF